MPKVQRRRGDHGAQRSARHGGFHLAALLGGEAAVVERYRQGVVVELPKLLKDDFGLGAGIDEDQCRAGLADLVVDLPQRMDGHPAGPGQALAGRQDIDLGAGSRPAQNGADIAVAGAAGLRQVGGQVVPVGDGGGQADAAAHGGQLRQPGEAEGQQVAALGAGQRVQLIDHDAAEMAEDLLRVGVGEHQRQALRRRHQDLRRLGPLALALGGGGVSRAGFGADRQAEFGDRAFQVALDIDRQRLQRRDIEGVQALARAFRQVDQAGQETGQRLAAAGRRDQQGVRAVPRGLQHLDLVGVGRPAAIGEPAQEVGRQQGLKRRYVIHGSGL